MRGDVHIALVADAPYRPGLETVRASMSRAAEDPGRLVFHEFGEKETGALDAEIRRDFGTYKGSSANFVRLYLPQLLPDADWVIYSDVDTIWLRDPCLLWDLRDPSRSAQWVADLDSTVADYRRWCRRKGLSPNPQYACSGIMLINLAKWRKDGIFQRCRDFIKAHGLPDSPDQDLLNTVLAGSAALLPPEWDVLVPDAENCRGSGDPFRMVLHLTGVGRHFGGYSGNVIQYRLWHLYRRLMSGGKVARDEISALARVPVPFCPRKWMEAAAMPFASRLLRMRARRVLAYSWLVRQRGFFESFVRRANGASA